MAITKSTATAKNTPEETATPNAINTGNTLNPPPSDKRKGKRGPRTKAPLVWTPEMDAALVRILRQPKGEGMVRTASSVSFALNKLPEFEGSEVVATQVTSRVNSFVSDLERAIAEGKRPGPIPAWVSLDVNERRKPDLALFD